MNIYTEKFIAETRDISGVTYQTDRGRHAESIIMTVKPATGGKAGKHYFSHNAAMYSAWMQILDYGMPDDVKTPDIIKELESVSRTQLSLAKMPTPRLVTSYIDGMTPATCAETIKTMLKALERSLTERPALAFLYPLYFTVLRGIHLYGKKKLKAEAYTETVLPALKQIDRFLSSFEIIYREARSYCEAVFLTANAPTDGFLPADMASVYHSYCIDHDLADFYTDSMQAMTMQPSLLSKKDVPLWNDYLDAFLTDSGDEKKKIYPLTSFEQFLHIGIDRLIQTESVLRVCKLCGGYFRIRFSSTQEYCTRLYGKTKATCNEYASRKSYKDRLFKHPIHTEFTKSYNRLYGRIRRGKLPEDTPLMDELKALHDEYYLKYENTHRQDREAVWREYMQKNKELLG